MMGITFTLMKLDAELRSLIDLEADSMGLKQFAVDAAHLTTKNK
jgi:hypothetical protein